MQARYQYAQRLVPSATVSHHSVRRAVPAGLCLRLCVSYRHFSVRLLYHNITFLQDIFSNDLETVLNLSIIPCF